MIGARAGKSQRPAVAVRRVPDVLGEAVLRIVAVEIAHERIAGRLGEIEAAAIDIERPSPPMIGRAGQAKPSGASRPSMSARSGRKLRAASPAPSRAAPRREC